MAWSERAIELAKQGAKSEPAKKAAAKAAEAAAAGAGALGLKRYKDRRERRQNCELAITLARQISGKYSEGTIVDGIPRFVVWKDGRAFDTFPRPDGEFSREDLAQRPELQDFPDALLKDPPPVPNQ